MEENLQYLGEQIIGAAMRVHTALEPGLLESAYEACLFHEQLKTNLKIARQVDLPICYDGVNLNSGYRLDMVVEEKIVLELKAVEQLSPLHAAQLISYLRLGAYPIGYLLNFNVIHMRDGIRRLRDKQYKPPVPPLPPC